MKIVVLGACADMAVPILPLLGQEADVEKIKLADIRVDKARELATKLGPKYEAARLDANDPASLAEVLAGSDVAMGYVGPFYHFETIIAGACIDAHVNYVSISDDYDAYMRVSELDAAAKAAGVTIISGLGNSPGITNLLAKKGYQSMDCPERINISWTGGSDEAVGPANVKHVMHIFEGKTLQWRDGHEEWVKCGGGEKVVDFPAPIGRHTVFYTGHAESVSVPRNLPGLKEVTLHGGVKPVWVARFATVCGRLGLTTTHSKREKMARILAPVLNVFKMGGTADKSVFRIDAYGTNKGAPCHNWYAGVGHIAEITSFPLMEGALAVGRGEVKVHGVFAAEGALEPDDFLPRLQKRGVELEYHEGA